MTCEVWFYHLERTGLDQALPELLSKTRGRGWKAVVRSPDAARLAHLDAWLWNWRDDSFLAHGLDHEPFPERQPILLTSDSAVPNAAEAVFLLDDAEPGDLDGFQRCLVLFDGNDDDAVTAARARWTAIKARGLPVSYWRQTEDGSWTKQA
ncbi:MAG: DNA polymerase III subunit chi [Caulobacteraceae bacterium]